MKPGQVLNPERIPTSPTPDEQAAIVFNVCYLEQQQQSGDVSSILLPIQYVLQTALFSSRSLVSGRPVLCPYLPDDAVL